MGRRALLVAAAGWLAAGCVPAPPRPTPVPEDDFGITPVPPLTEDQVVLVLRRNLRRRGIASDVVTGPMAVVPSRDHPHAEMAIEGDEMLSLAASWPPGAWLVVTNGGRWWVWDYGSVAPADDLARRLTTASSVARTS